MSTETGVQTKNPTMAVTDRKSLNHSLFTRFVLALFVCTLLFSKQIRMFTNEENRLFMHWDRLDGIAMVLALTVCALFALGVDVLLSRPRLLAARRLYRHLYLVLLLSSLVPYIIPYLPVNRDFDRNVQLIWGLIVLAVLVIYAFRLNRVLAAAKSASLIFSPLVPILFLQVLTWPAFGTPAEQPRFLRKTHSTGTPIFLFVFDEWSYVRSVRNGRYLPSLPHVNQLAAQSIVFRRAQSEAPYTKRSVPKIVYQADRPLVLKANSLYLADGGRLLPTRTQSSLFTGARADGYNTALVGFYLPYRFMLGGNVDYCVAYTRYNTGTNLFTKMMWSVLRNMDYWPDPFSKRVGSRWLQSRWFERWREIEQGTHRHALRLIQEAPPNTLAYIHEAGAHTPFTFSRQAALLRSKSTDPAEYQCQLERVDGYIGEVLQQLQASHRWDDALLIVTSDHSWRDDPDLLAYGEPGWQCRVPLFIKWPHQKKAVLVDRPYSLIHLQPLVELAMRGGTLAQAQDMIRAFPVLPIKTRLYDANNVPLARVPQEE